MKRAGYVLVGGRSSRMGTDKALLTIHGEALAARIAREVAAAAGAVALVGDPVRYASLGFPVIPDLFPGEGPLGGIAAALSHTHADWNLVVACDMPELTADFLEELFSLAENSGRLTVPRGPTGRMEPLCAVWPRSTKDAVLRAFGEGKRRVSEAIRGLDAREYVVAEVTHFENVNTPADWSRHAAE